MNRWPQHKAWFWESAPFFRVLLPFVLGIVVYDAGIFPKQQLGWLMVLLVLNGLLGFVVWGGWLKGAQRLAFGCVFLSLLAGGFLLSSVNDIRNNRSWFGARMDKDDQCLVRIVGYPAERERNFKLNVEVLDRVHEGKVTPVKGRAFVYLEKGIVPMMYHKGDTLLVNGCWQRISNRGNPFEFDYQRFCSRNGIDYQLFCKPHDARLFGAQEYELLPLQDRMHDWCFAQLDQYLTDSVARGLLQAMILGDEVNLDEHLRESYTATGIVHVIAISGGNILMFFELIALLLVWIGHRKHLWLKYVIALPLVWGYVMISGASPSAVRAAIMFSLYAIVIVLDKNQNPLNQLFSASFLLLVAQPMWLFAMGFQLSVVAVLSLILFYGRIQSLVKIEKKWLRWGWQVVAASVAAEVLVAPLVVFYFHQFPLYFIVSNLIAIALTTIVLYGGIAIILFSGIPVLAAFTATCLTGIVQFVNHFIDFLTAVSPAAMRSLQLSAAEAVLIYGVIGGIGYFIMRKNKIGLFTGLGAACLLFLLLDWDAFQHSKQDQLIVYNTTSGQYMERITGHKYKAVQEDSSETAKGNFAAKEARTHFGAVEKDNFGHQECFVIRGKKALVLDDPALEFTGHFKVDYLILLDAKAGNIKTLVATFQPGEVVLESGIDEDEAGRISDTCKKLRVVVHDVGKDGAMVIK